MTDCEGPSEGGWAGLGSLRASERQQQRANYEIGQGGYGKTKGVGLGLGVLYHSVTLANEA